MDGDEDEGARVVVRCGEGEGARDVCGGDEEGEKVGKEHVVVEEGEKAQLGQVC